MTQRGEAAVYIDWADDSNNSDIFSWFEEDVSTQQVAETLNNFLTSTMLVSPIPLISLPIHLVGHSRGASMMSSLARKFGERGIWIDHLTLLDANDWFGADENTTVHSNTIFADSYYQNDGLIINALNPRGESVPNALNFSLNAIEPDITHTNIHQFYRGTVDLETPLSASWYTQQPLSPRDSVGYAWSRLGGVPRPLSGVGTAFGGSASRVPVAAVGLQWPNVGLMRITNGYDAVPGANISVSYLAQDRDSSATITFFRDVDDNPFNGTGGDIGIATITPGEVVPDSRVFSSATWGIGTFWIGARITDGGRTRYAYIDRPVVIEPQPETHRLYFPEGFRSASVNEYIPLVNPNPYDISYTIIARYEVGERDQTISQGVIRATSRGGITTTEAINPSQALVRAGVGYAIEIRSSGPLGATLSHYDFGVATGEAFVSTPSTAWTFDRVVKQPGQSLDFGTWYNTSELDGAVTITVHHQSGAVSRVWGIGALRRGGISFNDETWVPDGIFRVTLVSTVPLVASLSHYQQNVGQGSITLGNPSPSALRGAIPVAPLGESSTFALSMSNPNPFPAYPSVRIVYEDGTTGPSLDFEVPASGLRILDRQQLPLPSGRRGAVHFASTVAISATMIVNDPPRGDALGVPALDRIAHQWLFADAYMSIQGAGAIHSEFLSIYNPHPTELSITLSFYFLDGTTSVVNRTIPAERTVTVLLHEEAAVLANAQARGGQTWFSVGVASTSAFGSTLVHWDLGQLGGWETSGTPFGAVTVLM